MLAWHPSGNLLASTSHDLMLKFWCREPSGSKLEQLSTELNQENPPLYYRGPLSEGTYIAPVRNPSTTPATQMPQSTTDNYHRSVLNQRERGGVSGAKDYYRERRSDGNRGKRFRESGIER
jgi:hypothetical protein